MLKVYLPVVVKTLAVWYKVGEFGDGFWFIREMEPSEERKVEPGLVESLMKTLLKRETLLCDPQLSK